MNIGGIMLLLFVIGLIVFIMYEVYLYDQRMEENNKSTIEKLYKMRRK